MPDKQKCIKCATRISWIGIWDSLFLTIFKGVIGILTRSRALTASSLYSLHDVISGVAVLIGLKVSTRPADKKHPYGHGNAEYIVGVFTSILILGATIYLIADCIRIVFMGEHAPPHWAALGAAVISLFANEIIYRFNICAWKQMNSPALLAHGKHHRADAISSLAVAIAIIGGMMGYRSLDAIVAIFEAGHLIYLSIELLYQDGSGLVDRAIKECDISLIRQVVSDVPDVKSIEDIKTRQIGRSVWVDLHVSFAGNKTIKEIHEISNKIRQGIDEKIQYLGNVNVICE
jgi:cation diffusion facilitator family transporter